MIEERVCWKMRCAGLSDVRQWDVKLDRAEMSLIIGWMDGWMCGWHWKKAQRLQSCRAVRVREYYCQVWNQSAEWIRRDDSGWYGCVECNDDDDDDGIKWSLVQRYRWKQTDTENKISRSSVMGGFELFWPVYSYGQRIQENRNLLKQCVCLCVCWCKHSVLSIVCCLQYLEIRQLINFFIRFMNAFVFMSKMVHLIINIFCSLIIKDLSVFLFTSVVWLCCYFFKKYWKLLLNQHAQALTYVW